MKHTLLSLNYKHPLVTDQLEHLHPPELRGCYPQAAIQIVTHGEVGLFKGERIQEKFREVLAEQQIDVQEHSIVTRIRPNGIEQESKFVPADCVILAGGFRASSIPKNAGIDSNDIDQIKVNLHQKRLRISLKKGLKRLHRLHL
ncbi:MAG: NADH dehydrogenase FAD-containing subunit [Cellvibrionaceae bacterium]